MKTIFLLLTTALTLFAENPLGQTADYKLDKNPKRTSSMIQSGTVHASVPTYIENAETAPSYQVNLDYHFNLGMMGVYNGTEKAVIEKEFFTSEFIESLRINGTYKGKYFNAKHMGFADAKNMDGKFYPHCDKVLLTDLKKPGTFLLIRDLLSTMLSTERDNIEDLKVLAHIFVGVPVIGAVKLDVSGVYNGMAVKAGGDYSSATH